MHLNSLYRGSEDAKAYESGEARLAACWLQSQMAQLLHECVTCDQNQGYGNHYKVDPGIYTPKKNQLGPEFDIVEPKMAT